MVRVLSRHEDRRLTGSGSDAATALGSGPAGDRRPGPGRVLAKAIRPRRRLTATAVVIYLLLYLWAIQNLIVTRRDFSGFVDIPSAQVVPNWTSRVFDQIAPFSYEPVVQIVPVNHVKLLLSPVNAGMGLLLGILVALNLALAIHLLRTALVCRRRAFTGLLGAIPGLFMGFACCAPTVALVLGAQFAAGLIAIRSWFFPGALAFMVLTLAWNLRRGSRLAVAAAELAGQSAQGSDQAAELAPDRK